MPSPDLARELRENAPVASPVLRARVAAVPDRAAAPRPLPRRRLAVAAAAAALLLVAGIAAAVELTRSPARRGAAPPATTTASKAFAGAGGVERAIAPAPAAAPPAARLKNVDAYLRLRVAGRPALSSATRRAQ